MKVWIHVHDASRARGRPSEVTSAPPRRICWYVGTSDAQVLSAARLQLQLPADAEFLLRDTDGDLVPIASTLPHDHHFSLVLAEHLIAAAAVHSGASSAAADYVTTAAAVAVSAASNKRPGDSVLASASESTPAQPTSEDNAPHTEAFAVTAIAEAALTAGDLAHHHQQLQHKRRKVKSYSPSPNEHPAVVNGGGPGSLDDAGSSAALRQSVAVLPLTSTLVASLQPAPAIATTASPVLSPVVAPVARARSIATIVTQFLETFTKPILNDDNVNFIPNTGKYGLYALYSEIVADPSFHPKGQDAFYKMTAMQGKVDRQRVIRFYQDRLPSGSVEYVQYKPQGKGPFLRKYLVIESERTMQELIKSAGFVALMDLEPEQVVTKYLSFVKGFRPISKADYRAHQNGNDGF